MFANPDRIPNSETKIFYWNQPLHYAESMERFSSNAIEPLSGKSKPVERFSLDAIEPLSQDVKSPNNSPSTPNCQRNMGIPNFLMFYWRYEPASPARIPNNKTNIFYQSQPLHHTGSVERFSLDAIEPLSQDVK